MKSIRALHIASFNGNIGDNANHNGFRNRLNSLINIPVHFEELEMREFYQSWNLRDFNSKKFIDLCNSYDLVIIGGGNFFELNWDYSHTGTTVNFKNETLDRIETPILFHAVGCDVSKGASQEAIDKFDNFLEKLTSEKKYLVSLRNDGSSKVIENLYGDKYNEKVLYVPDGAFFLETQKYNFPEISKGYKSIGVNIVSDMKDIRFNPSEDSNHIGYEQFLAELANEINHLLEENMDYQIIFFPHIYSDLLAISNILENINDQFRRTRIVIAPYLTGPESEKYIFGLYNECEFIMGMRFHSNVCAIAQEIPTIALSSYQKIIDLYKEIGLSERLIEVNQNGFSNKLREQINYTLENTLVLKEQYKEVNKRVYLESMDFYNKLNNWLLENKIIN